jgi:hypothetical protein
MDLDMTLAAEINQKSLAVFLERIEAQDDLSADDVRELAATCAIPLAMLEKHWQLIQELLDRGIEGKQLSRAIVELLGILDLGIDCFTAARRKMEAASVSAKDRDEAMSKLDRAATRASQMRDDLKRLLANLEKPLHIDPTTLPQKRGDQNADGYVPLDRLANRLTSPT